MTPAKPNRSAGRGPFRPEHLRSGDPYELSNGHPIECLPQGGRNSRANLVGGVALATDPAVEAAGVDTGYAPDGHTLRAPDLAVGNVPDAPGWVAGVPPLAVEYADTGQDEADLKIKIGELLGAGTRLVWVVRLVGPRRVEVHAPGRPPEVRTPGDLLVAPGILKNPVPVEALFDPAAAREAALRNLLQRQGYESLEAVRSSARAEGLAEGVAQGLAEGVERGLAEGMAQGLTEGALQATRAAILQVLDKRGLILDTAHRATIESCTDPHRLALWLDRALDCTDAGTLLEQPSRD